jgi:TonB family protein
MKKTPCLAALVAAALLIALAGCQSAPAPSLLDQSQYQPIAAREWVMTGEYHSLGDVDTLPRQIGTRTPPVYPLELKLRGISTEVMIVFMVNTEGKTEQVQATRATHAAFADTAIQAVQKWRFTPATKDGKPVNCVMSLPISAYPTGGISVQN